MHSSLCTYDDLSPGQKAAFTKTISAADLSHFIAISGDVNPLHVDAVFARRTFFRKPIAHGMLVGSLFSHVLGMLMPGTGAIYRSQYLNFVKPVYVGDTVQVTLEITCIDRKNESIEMCGAITNQHGDTVIKGTCMASLLRGFVD